MQSVPISTQVMVPLRGTKVTLECFPAEGAKEAVVVCPGGSYCWLDYQNEGIEVARWLQRAGFSAFVLRYRVAGWWAWATHYRFVFPGFKQWQPKEDADKALQYLWDNLGFRDIGIMGFSAGGHLAMTAACSDSRYRWVAPIYPVVSMEAACTHGRSRRALLGEWGQHSSRLRRSYSIEQQVHSQTPPVFLVACKDDPVVDYHNSVLLDQALAAHQIPHRFLLYNTGGHGFGACSAPGTSECRAWKEEFLEWHNTLPNKQ